VQQAAAHFQSTNQLHMQGEDEARVMERQLAWLVYAVGALVGGHVTMGSQTRKGDEVMDAAMCRQVFELMSVRKGGGQRARGGGGGRGGWGGG
jgi:hypothetical protein